MTVRTVGLFALFLWRCRTFWHSSSYSLMLLTCTVLHGCGADVRTRGGVRTDGTDGLSWSLVLALGGAVMGGDRG